MPQPAWMPKRCPARSGRLAFVEDVLQPPVDHEALDPHPELQIGFGGGRQTHGMGVRIRCDPHPGPAFPPGAKVGVDAHLHAPTQGVVGPSDVRPGLPLRQSRIPLPVQRLVRQPSPAQGPLGPGAEGLPCPAGTHLPGTAQHPTRIGQLHAQISRDDGVRRGRRVQGLDGLVDGEDGPGGIQGPATQGTDARPQFHEVAQFRQEARCREGLQQRVGPFHIFVGELDRSAVLQPTGQDGVGPFHPAAGVPVSVDRVFGTAQPGPSRTGLGVETSQPRLGEGTAALLVLVHVRSQEGDDAATGQDLPRALDTQPPRVVSPSDASGRVLALLVAEGGDRCARIGPTPPGPLFLHDAQGGFHTEEIGLPDPTGEEARSAVVAGQRGKGCPSPDPGGVGNAPAQVRPGPTDVEPGVGTTARHHRLPLGIVLAGTLAGRGQILPESTEGALEQILDLVAVEPGNRLGRARLHPHGNSPRAPHRAPELEPEAVGSQGVPEKMEGRGGGVGGKRIRSDPADGHPAESRRGGRFEGHPGKGTRIPRPGETRAVPREARGTFLQGEAGPGLPGLPHAVELEVPPPGNILDAVAEGLVQRPTRRTGPNRNRPGGRGIRPRLGKRDADPRTLGRVLGAPGIRRRRRRDQPWNSPGIRDGQDGMRRIAPDGEGGTGPEKGQDSRTH
jgi:hypothetical protein